MNPSHAKLRILPAITLSVALAATAPYAAAQLAPAGPDTVHVATPTGERETDRASILAALEQVRPGETVQFASGTYMVGEIIDVAISGVTLLGNPDGTTLRGCDPVAWQQMMVAAAEALIGEARWNMRARCGMLRLTGGHVTVRNLTFEDTVWGLVLGWMDPTLTSEGGHHIEGNTFRNSGNGIRVGNQSSGPTIIRQNRFINTYHALGGHGGHLHFLENDISVPEPERVPDPGYPGNAIALCGEHNVIAGNRIAGHPEGISMGWGWEVVDACRHNVIRDNTIIVQRTRALTPPPGFRLLDESDSTLVGTPLILGHPSGEGAFEDNLIEGNHIIGAEGIGIEVRNASRNRIVNNTITGVLRRKPFPGNWSSEFDQEWRDANGSGIWLSPGSDENDIIGNVFEDVAGHAVVIEGDRNRVHTRSAGDAVRDMGSGNRVSGPTSPLAAEVHAMMEQFVAGLNDESPGRVARFFAGDATLTVTGGAVLAGREAIVREFLRPNVARIRGIRLTSPEIVAADSRVTVASAFAARFAPAADTVRARLSTTWARQPDGSWLIAATTFGLPADPQDGPIRSRYFQSDGIRLHYLDFGGEGVPVVLMPVRDRTAYSFVEFVERFAGRNRVLAITSRGSGESEGELEETFDLVAAARDVIALLDAVGIERAVVIPWWDAQIGVYLAEQHPERISGLVFPGGAPGPDWISLWDEDPTGVLEMAPRLFSAQDGEDPDEAMRKLRSRPRYEAGYLNTADSIDIPALMLVSETGEAEVADRWQRDLALARRVAADPLTAPDSLARAFYLRLAADGEMREDVRAVYRDLVAPAYETAETAFRQAFGKRLHIVQVTDRALVYGYRDAPDLIYPHIRDFLDEVSARERSRSETPPAGVTGSPNRK
jgi:parallel beta-helix repeat protein